MRRACLPRYWLRLKTPLRGQQWLTQKPQQQPQPFDYEQRQQKAPPARRGQGARGSSIALPHDKKGCRR